MLPVPFYAALAGMAVVHLALIETVKHFFYRVETERPAGIPHHGRGAPAGHRFRRPPGRPCAGLLPGGHPPSTAGGA